MSESKQPSHRAYTLIGRGGDDGEEGEKFWLNIGSVFPHGDGKGFNIVLEALPLDGKLVLRELKEKEPPPPAKKGYQKR
jgi:hypothetical protein